MTDMRAFLASFMGLWLAVHPALAMLTVTELHGFNASSGGATPTIAFLQCGTQTSTGSATITVSAQNTGTASSSRVTIVGVLAEDSASTFSVNGLTVGGDAATEVVDEDGTGVVNSALYILTNTADTSEDVVITFSESVSEDVTVCLWQANDLSSLTAVAATADDDTSSGVLVLDLSATSADGIAVGVCLSAVDASETTTWTGLTEREDADVGTHHSSAADTSPTDGSALTVRCDWTGTGDASGVAAAFR